MEPKIRPEVTSALDTQNFDYFENPNFEPQVQKAIITKSNYSNLPNSNNGNGTNNASGAGGPNSANTNGGLNGVGAMSNSNTNGGGEANNNGGLNGGGNNLGGDNDNGPIVARGGGANAGGTTSNMRGGAGHVETDAELMSPKGSRFMPVNHYCFANYGYRELQKPQTEQIIRESLQAINAPINAPTADGLGLRLNDSSKNSMGVENKRGDAPVGGPFIISFCK